MMRGINFKVSKVACQKQVKFITIDIDSSVVNVEGHQEGAVTRRVLRERIQSKKAWEQLLQHPVCLL